MLRESSLQDPARQHDDVQMSNQVALLLLEQTQQLLDRLSATRGQHGCSWRNMCHAIPGGGQVRDPTTPRP